MPCLLALGPSGPETWQCFKKLTESPSSNPNYRSQGGCHKTQPQVNSARLKTRRVFKGLKTWQNLPCLNSLGTLRAQDVSKVQQVDRVS